MARPRALRPSNLGLNERRMTDMAPMMIPAEVSADGSRPPTRS